MVPTKVNRVVRFQARAIVYLWLVVLYIPLYPLLLHLFSSTLYSILYVSELVSIRSYYL
jgi:hypothetical protein